MVFSTYAALNDWADNPHTRQIQKIDCNPSSLLSLFAGLAARAESPVGAGFEAEGKMVKEVEKTG
jgi:hypothetical protein